MNNKRGILAAAGAALFGLFLVPAQAAFYLSDYEKGGVHIAAVNDPVTPGEWHFGWAKCKAYAEEHDLPMLAVWGSTTCFHCELFGEMLTGDKVKAWQASEKGKIVLCMMLGGESACPDQEFSAGYDWAGGTGGSWSEGQFPWSGYLNQYPWVCFYWKSKQREYHGEGDAIRGGTYVTEDEGADNFLAALDKWFAGFPEKPKYNGGVFKVSGTETSRLEIEVEKTAYIDVPLVRTNGVEFAATNIVYAGDSAGETIYWKANEKEKFWRVTVSSDSYTAGDTLVLKLSDETGTNIVAQSEAVFTTSAAPSIDNPLWFGERTTTTLSAGEWTMDLATAKARTLAQSGEAWTLVAVVGSLWCPDCKRLATNLTDNAEFKTWAQDNNVALVQIDAPYGTGDGPCLLTYEETWGRSGAGYLSRKMADAAKAAEALAANKVLYTETWSHTPGTRLRLPTLLLLDKHGTVKARIGDDSLSFAPEYMILRLNEMISAARESGEETNWRAMGAEPLLPGTPVSALASAVDSEDCYTPSTTEGRIKATLRRTTSGGREAGAPGKGVLSIQRQDGSQIAIAAFGPEDSSVSVSADLSGAAVCIRVAMDTASAGSPQWMNSTRTTEFPYEISYVQVAVPKQDYATVAATDALRESGFTVQVKKDAAYRFEGVGELPQELAVYLSKSEESGPADESLYQGLADGDVTLPVAANATSVGYGLWNSGEIAFSNALSVRKVYESAVAADETLSVEFGVARTGGTSGGVSVKVVVSAENTTCYAERYRYNETVLSWADGESGEKKVSFLLSGDSIHDETQTLAFELVPVGGVLSISEGGGLVVFEIIDDDSLNPGVLAITDSTPPFTGNRFTAAAAGSAVTFSVAREPGPDGGMSGDSTAILRIVDASGNTLGGSAALAWEHRSAENVKTATLDLPAYDKDRRIVYVELVPGEGAPVDAARGRVAVEILPAGMPRFEANTAGGTFYRYVKAEVAVGLSNIAGLDFMVNKVSGALPPGMKAEIAGATFKISGTPVAAGKYRAVYMIAQSGADATACGDMLAVDISVVAIPDKAEEVTDGEPQVVPNPAICKALVFQNIPIVAKIGYVSGKAANGVAGLLSLSISPTGKASAKIQGGDGGTKVFSAEGWSGYDPETGDATVALAGYGANLASCGLEVVVHPSGDAVARLQGNQLPGGEQEIELAAASAEFANDLVRFAGRYNVQLPQEGVIADSAEAGAGEGNTIAVMSLRMVSATAIANGRMAYVAYLPDGRCATGSAALLPSAGEKARMPVLCCKDGTVFAGALDILPDASATHTLNGGKNNWFVSPAEGVRAYWMIPGAEANVRETAALGAYGGFYDGEETLLYSCCLNTYGDTNLWFAADSLVSLRDGGAVLEFAPVPVAIREDGLAVDESAVANPARLRVSFDRANGVFSGTVRASAGANGMKRVLSFRGVVMPGWGGCEDCGRPLPRPIGAGPCWFMDMGTSSFRNSGEIAIDAISE